MDATPVVADDLTRLKAVQARVRALARNHLWFADAIRASFDGFMAIGERHTSEKSAMYNRGRRLARDLLEKGRLSDPNSNQSGIPLLIRIQGLCPSDLAERLEQPRPSNAMPDMLEQEGAKAALAALDREEVFETRDPTDGERSEVAAAIAAKTHVSFTWRILVATPSDWQEPADPLSLERADLERFSDSDYRTIALHHLGGLADVGALRPIVPKPIETGHSLRDVSTYFAWRFRLPIFEEDRNEDQPPLNLRALPVEVAEQMLDDVEIWAKAEAASRGEVLVGSGSRVATDVKQPPHPATALTDSLDALVVHFSNARIFRDLAERRNHLAETHLNIANAVGIQAGEAPHSNELPELAEQLRRRVLNPASAACERARAALRAGAAAWLDGSGVRSVELLTTLREAEQVLVALSMGVGDPRVIIDRDAARMDEIGERFARTRDEVVAVLETRGLEAPTPPTVSVSPELVDLLQRTAAVDSNAIERAAERVAERVIVAFNRGAEDTPARKLPELGTRDTEAWQASLVAGMTQARIADLLNRKHPGENWTQPRVSEAIKRAKAHAEASGLAGKVAVAQSRAPARTLDPSAANAGQRTDGRSKHLREKAKQIADGE